MKPSVLTLVLLIVAALGLSNSPGYGANGISYQGYLTQEGEPAGGQFEMVFELSSGAGTAGTSLTIDPVRVKNGLFAVELDFGPDAFDGTPRQLSISVRPSGSDGPFAPLLPPQSVTPAPEALHARTVGSVPDTALSSNVALLDAAPTFAGVVQVASLRVEGAAGEPDRLIFGPTLDCRLEVDPAGPPGLLLRDPSGIRILPTDQLSPPALIFGPTDDCSLSIDPSGQLTGLIESDPVGFRLLGRDSQGCRLIFGPTMDCTVEIDPGGPGGLLLRDPSGIRILPRNPLSPPSLIFGPTDDCSLSIDPSGRMLGLIESDPVGFRLLGQDSQGCRLIFGPTMDCTVEVNAGLAPGLLLRDPNGIRILSTTSPTGGPTPPRLFFGPTDDCSLWVDPTGRLAGLIESDPVGFRLLGPGGQGCRLIFGPTMDCTVEIDPTGPGGLLLRDPRGIRILPTDPGSRPALIFGPTDDCSLSIDPTGQLAGLIESDPVGFRLLGRDSQGCRLIFGPTMDCTVEIDPNGPGGLLLRDPAGVRILPRDPGSTPALVFGPTDDCSLSIDPTGQMPGLIESDPVGFRLLGRDSQGCRLIFGPTMDCTVEVNPGLAKGLLLRDPDGIRILPTQRVGFPPGPPKLVFGPTDECRITVNPEQGAAPGMQFSDPRGFGFDHDVQVAGAVQAQEFIQSSSRRFKSEIRPIEQPLQKIQKLQGVHFTWEESKGGKKDVGFIAEEVAEVIPEVVAWETDGENARGVNYGHLVAVAIEGIKAQQTQIESLEAEKVELKKSLLAMQQQIDRLSQQMGRRNVQ